MDLRKLVLRDFGTFDGTVEIDLSVSGGRPIILVGGANGSGKTTLLEAILLSLHGRKAIGSLSEREYSEYIQSRMHAPPAQSVPNVSMAVSLEFSHIEMGEFACYRVDRTWESVPGAKVAESIQLFRDGACLDELPETAWQDFLDGLVPPGVADLFFFDGERIKDLAEDESGSQLKQAVYRLLGIDLLEQLKTDLLRFASKAQSLDASGLTAQLQATSASLEEKREEASALASQLDLIADERLGALESRSIARNRFGASGGTLALERQRTEEGLEEASRELDELEDQLRELVEGLLPFALAPRIAKSLSETLTRERQHYDNQVVARRVSDSAGELEESLVSRDADGDVLSHVRALLGVDQVSAEPHHWLHNLSLEDEGKVQASLAQLAGDVTKVAPSIATRLRKTQDSKQRLQDLLDKVPDDSELEQPLKELQEAERTLGALEAKETQTRESLEKVHQATAQLERELSRIAELLENVEGGAEKIQLAVRAGRIAEVFQAELLKSKLFGIETSVARHFNSLSRKGEMLKEVKIDLEDFTIKPIRWDAHELDRSLLSAGEKQLLAISILWSLAEISRLPLPVVIDTPLARLDASHRENLLRDYFPSVSHQVVVLSTDTEIDAAAYDRLRSSISRSFHLSHDSHECSTSLVPGYFPELEVAASDVR